MEDYSVALTSKGLLACFLMFDLGLSELEAIEVCDYYEKIVGDERAKSSAKKGENYD